MPTITAPFQRRITNPLQRPLSSDLNLQAFYDSVTQSYMGGIMFSPSPSAPVQFPDGFVGNSFRCSAAVSSREVIVQRGIGFINQIPEDGVDGIAGVNVGQYVPVVCEPDSPLSAGISLPVADLATGLARIDIVCVKAPNLPTDIQNIGILNPTASTFSFLPKPTQFTENAFDSAFIQVVTGTPTGGTPTAPSVPSGYLEIGRIYVPVGSAALSNSNIEDRRNVLIPHGGRSMVLSFDSHQDGSTVVGTNFGNNGIHAVVRAVYSTPPSSGNKTFEVYVSSAATDPSVFELCTTGFAQNNVINGLYYGSQATIVQKSIVTRAAAQPFFDAVGGTQSILGPTIAKFTVAVGPLYISGGIDYPLLNSQAAVVDSTIGSSTVRCMLFAQAI